MLGISSWREALSLMILVRPELLLPGELAQVPVEVWLNSTPPSTFFLPECLDRIPHWSRLLYLKPPLPKTLEMTPSDRLTELSEAYLKAQLPFPQLTRISERWKRDRLMELVEIGCSRPGLHLLALSALAMSPADTQIIDRMLLSPWPELFFARSMRRLVESKPIERVLQIFRDLRNGVATEDTVCLEPNRLERLPKGGEGRVSKMLSVLHGKQPQRPPAYFWTSKIGQVMAQKAVTLLKDRPAIALLYFGPAALDSAMKDDLRLAEVEQFCQIARLADCLEVMSHPALLAAYWQQSRFILAPSVLHHQLATKGMLAELERILTRPASPSQVTRFFDRLGASMQLGEGGQVVQKLRAWMKDANVASRHLFEQFMQSHGDGKHPLIAHLRSISLQK